MSTTTTTTTTHTDEVLSKILTRRKSRELTISAKDRAAVFHRMCKEHSERQHANPFSEHHDGKVVKKKLDKSDPTYGKPLAGSLTEQRGKAANEHVKREIEQLCQIIYEIALYDPECPGPDCFVKFKPLFEYYNRISDKLVGLLMRARKYGYVSFEGEMLYQRRDDHVKITLNKSGFELIKKTSA